MRPRLNYRTRAPGIVTALVLALAFIVVPMQPAQAGSLATVAPVTNADGRLGLCDVLAGSPVADSGPTWAQLAYSAGARTNRWEFRMDKLESAQGVWDFSATDAVVASDTAGGLNTEGILIGTPRWAVRPGQTPGNGLPAGLRRPVSDPANVWADFVRQTVRHYAHQVAYWEIWNEPDLKYFWTSSPADYYALLKVSYTVIKSVDPTARVVMAGMVVPDLAFLSSVLDAARSDPSSHSSHGYFDIAAWHAYGTARLVYTNVSRMQSILTAHGYGDAPIWVTEAGFPASNPNGEPRQAAYVLQSIAYAFAAGAERVFVYRASDDPTPKTWGVISAAGIPRLAYTAFAVAARYLSHVQAVTYNPTPAAERFEFFTPQNRISLVWNHDITSHSLSLSAGNATGQHVDWQGTVSPLLAAGGQFNFTIPGATYNAGADPTGSVVGGPPVMVVESNVRPGNLGAPAFIPPVAGPNRQLIVLNQSATPAVVEVSVPGTAWEREELRLRPHAVQLVDLDLLSGGSYTGLFRVSSTSPVTAQALSGPLPVPGIAPAAAWSVSAAPPSLLLSNPTAAAVTGHITGYGYGGKVRASQNFSLPPLGTTRWTAPAGLHGRNVSLSIQATGKIVVSGLTGPLANAIARPHDTWYTVAPQAGGLVVFNPDGSVPAQVNVRYVGAGDARGRQIRLAGHRSFTVLTRSARTVVVSANHAVSLGYDNPANLHSPLAAQPAKRAALTVGGATTRVSVYNPSTGPALVHFSIVGRAGTYYVTRLVGRAAVSTVVARTASDPPRGVVVSSDVPVVSTPTS